MKRKSGLMELIADADNLRLAFWKAAKGKATKRDCREFRGALDRELDALRRGLLSGELKIGDYHYFKVHDPKERLICAASFRERVLHHAMINICEPVLERAAIHDSYACRKGKGSLMAVARARSAARSQGWFLKMDMRKYFDSIDHATLRAQLARKFKESALLMLFDRILGSYQCLPGRGLPIGNLTSQHMANFYLSPLDRHIKETLKCRNYVRYMDDMVVWGQTGGELQAVLESVQQFARSDLQLELKSGTALNRTCFGMDFLGYRIFPDSVRLSRRSKARFARKFRRYEEARLAGVWSDRQAQQRMGALLAFVLPAQSSAFRRRVLERFGVDAKGLEPCVTRRQLEQQRDQLPVGEPEQQQPVEQQQQQRVPCGLVPSSTGSSDEGRADPATIPPVRLSGHGKHNTKARCQ